MAGLSSFISVYLLHQGFAERGKMVVEPRQLLCFFRQFGVSLDQIPVYFHQALVSCIFRGSGWLVFRGSVRFVFQQFQSAFYQAVSNTTNGLPIRAFFAFSNATALKAFDDLLSISHPDSLSSPLQ